MIAASDIRFGFAVAPVEVEGTPDAQLYGEVLSDCRLGAELGYASAWMIEHHFTDYFPTPSPLVFMAHVAAHCPRLGLGTCVLVTPWYHPVRFAEELAMLSLLTEADLHIGIGRGTAKLEYDVMGVAMDEARDRFREHLEIVRRALSGETLDYHGRFFRIDRRVPLRPKPRADRIHFYGAIGSPQSAVIMADLGLPPLSISSFPMEQQRSILENWQSRADAIGRPVAGAKPLVVHTFLADTDEEARSLARRYLPEYFRLQVHHYEVDANHWGHIKGYEQFSRMFANLKKLADPANRDHLETFIDLQFVGTPETVARRVEAYRRLGFDCFVVHAATPRVPRAVRHQSLRRFAADVAPRFDERFGQRPAT